MKTNDLEELAARFTASLRTTAEEALFFEIVPPALDLLARGKPVSVEEIAAVAGKSPEEVRVALGPGEWDEQGRVVGAGSPSDPASVRGGGPKALRLVRAGCLGLLSAPRAAGEHRVTVPRDRRARADQSDAHRDRDGRAPLRRRIRRRAKGSGQRSQRRLPEHSLL